jgi:hypothetical protein
MYAMIRSTALSAIMVLLLAGIAIQAHAAAGSARQAPVGHRQPTAQDVQNTQEDSSADQATKKIDEDLDRKLKSICRGC